jgi:hypothetical protein
VNKRIGGQAFRADYVPGNIDRLNVADQHIGLCFLASFHGNDLSLMHLSHPRVVHRRIFASKFLLKPKALSNGSVQIWYLRIIHANVVVTWLKTKNAVKPPVIGVGGGGGPQFLRPPGKWVLIFDVIFTGLPQGYDEETDHRFAVVIGHAARNYRSHGHAKKDIADLLSCRERQRDRSVGTFARVFFVDEPIMRGQESITARRNVFENELTVRVGRRSINLLMSTGMLRYEHNAG